MTGYVYIAQREDGRVKIGSTLDVRRRLGDHARQCGQRMRLIARALTADPIRVERALQAVNPSRVAEGREWFDISDEQVAELAALLADPEAIARLIPQTPLRSFSAWLEANPDAAAELNTTTRGRYASGAVPAFLVWFLENPGTLTAIAEDAKDLAPEDWERIRELINERASAARDRRFHAAHCAR